MAIRKLVLSSTLAAALLCAACSGTVERSCPEEQRALHLYESGALPAARQLLSQAWKSASGECRWRLKTLLADVHALRRERRQAVALLQEEPLPPGASPVVRFRFYLARGFADSSGEDLTEAARVAAEAKNPRWEVDALVRLANLENRQNQTAKAEANYAKAVSVADSMANERAAADAYAAQGFFFFRQERLSQAERALQRALALAEKLNLPLVAMRCRGNLGLTYLRWGDHARALDLITRAEATAREHKQTAQQVLMLQNLGNIQYMLGQPAVARNYLEQSLTLARGNHDRDSEAIILYNLLPAYIDAGELAKAEESAALSYRIRSAAGDATAEPFLRFSKARIQRAKGDFPAAAALLRGLLGRKGMLPWFTWSVHAELAAVEERAGNAAAAAAQYETAISLMHSAQESISSASAQFSFISENVGLHQQYIRFLASRGKAEEALRASDWGRVSGAGTQRMPSFTAARLRQVSRSRKETLVAFSLGLRESYGWVATESRFGMAVLPGEARIRAAIERWEREMDSPQRDNAASSALFAMLFEPLLGAAERSGTIVLAGDGILHRINPEALWTDGKYWIEKASVIRTSSIAAFAENRPPREAPPTLLAAGAPLPPAKEFPELPGAAEELRQIPHYFSASVLSGSAATPRAWRAARPESFGYLHFATHSIASAFDPSESMLVLSRGTEGYRLTAREIAAMSIRARLVTLASCRSAGERIGSGGLLGLGFAFLAAGAETVVASLWDVEDDAAVFFAKNLYRNLQAGDSVPESARKAKCSLLASSYGSTPRRWSPWIVLRGHAKPRL
ncbi:MAG: CHAT domain-containing protein [Bryobacterales bacterium]|nr:CHAT domain-containing protein [Bryobacterales bacterium]